MMSSFGPRHRNFRHGRACPGHPRLSLLCAWTGKLMSKSMTARDELRRELAQSLTSLINSISPTEIDKHNRDLLGEFVDNCEFGVALEWLRSLIVERSIQLSFQQEQEIQRLAQRMKIYLS
jgi:hypothetical protein